MKLQVNQQTVPQHGSESGVTGSNNVVTIDQAQEGHVESPALTHALSRIRRLVQVQRDREREAELSARQQRAQFD